MRLRIVAVGRLKKGPERELVERYAERLRGARMAGVTGFDVAELPESRAGDAPTRKREEGRAILDRLSDGGLVVALDETGRTPDSAAFAALVRDARDMGRDVTLVIGGPDGLDGAVRDRADTVLAFGRLTLPHQIVRALAAEQLYRAITILAGHPYHRT